MTLNPVGFITLLPPPTAPGLHLLDRSAKSEEESFWIPLEELIKDDEMLFYCGRALEFSFSLFSFSISLLTKFLGLSQEVLCQQVFIEL